MSSSIGDRTWLDINRNGIQDQFDGSDEPPMAGVEVGLKGTDDLGNAVSLSTKTDAQGAYGFPNLRASLFRGACGARTRDPGIMSPLL